MKNYFLYFSPLLIFTCIGCGKVAPDAYDYYKLPHTMYFILLDSAGKNLVNDSNRNLIKLYYYQDNKKQYQEDFAVFDSFPGYRFVCSTREAAYKSVNGIKTFYLENGESKIDTILIDVNYERNRDCMCMYPYKQVKFNGKMPERDSKNEFNPYLFVK